MLPQKILLLYIYWLLASDVHVFELDVDPQRDDDASPMSTYRCDLLECWFQLFSTSQIQFRTFLKKNQIFGSHVVVLVKTFPFHWRINYLCRTDIDKARAIFFSRRTYGNSGYGQNSISSISNFLKKILIFGIPWRSTREDLSIDVSITNVGLILTKLWWFQLFVESQNSNFELFWKKIQILIFLWYSTREDLPIYVSITNVELTLTKLGWFFFFRGTDRWTDGRTNRRTDRRTDRQTDTVLGSSYGNMSAHKKFQFKAQN